MQELNSISLFIERLNKIGVKYMICGSVASIFYGEPRMTHDIDLVLEITNDDIQKLVEAFPIDEFYCPPIDVISIEIQRATRGHFNIIHHKTGFKADLYFTGSEPVQFWGIQNRIKVEIDGLDYYFATPEYVILKKLEFYKEGKSEKHIRDIKSMLEMSEDNIDLESIKKYASILNISETLSEIL